MIYQDCSSNHQHHMEDIIFDPTAHSFFSPEKAEEIAAELNATDDWDYKVKHHPTGAGYSFIEVYDEDGEFISGLQL